MPARSPTCRSAASTLAFVMWLAVACSDAGRAPRGNTIAGSVFFDGQTAALGQPLAIAVYRSFPPKGPPVAWRYVEQYSFPYRYEFDDLPPGTYYVGALVDVDRMDSRHAGMLNPRRDPHGYAGGGEPIAVTALAGAAGADIRLEEPP